MPDKSRSKAGRFVKGRSGNPNGKPPGTISERVRQWEALVASLEGEQAAHFNSFMDMLWNGPIQNKALAAELYLKLLEFHKPKLARTEMKAPPGSEVTYTVKFK